MEFSPLEGGRKQKIKKPTSQNCYLGRKVVWGSHCCGMEARVAGWLERLQGGDGTQAGHER